MPVASQVNAGTVTLLRGDWNRDFLEELQDFPGGAKDDQVDALSRAFGLVLEGSRPARVSAGCLGTAIDGSTLAITLELNLSTDNLSIARRLDSQFVNRSNNGRFCAEGCGRTRVLVGKSRFRYKYFAD